MRWKVFTLINPRNLLVSVRSSNKISWVDLGEKVTLFYKLMNSYLNRKKVWKILDAFKFLTWKILDEFDFRQYFWWLMYDNFLLACITQCCVLLFPKHQSKEYSNTSSVQPSLGTSPAQGTSQAIFYTQSDLLDNFNQVILIGNEKCFFRYD